MERERDAEAQLQIVQQFHWWLASGLTRPDFERKLQPIVKDEDRGCRQNERKRQQLEPSPRALAR